ncbi:MAG: hypothetical protein RR645_03215, partial [Clostridium sp.]
MYDNKKNKYALNMSTYSDEHIEFVKKIKMKKKLIIITQLSILIIFFLAWEILATYKIIDPFLVSQ